MKLTTKPVRFFLLFAIVMATVSARSWASEPVWSVHGEPNTMPRLAFSADGHRLLSITQFDVSVLDAANGKEVARLATGSFERRFATGSLSGDGSRASLIVADGDTAWQMEDVDLMRSAEARRQAFSFEGQIEGHRVSASGRYHLIWGYGSPPLLIDTLSGTQHPVVTDGVAPVAAVASSGEIFVTTGDGLASLEPDGRENWRLVDSDLAFGVSGMALSPDGASLAVWEILDKEGRDLVRIYDVRERQRSRDLVLPPIGRAYVEAVRFDGESLIVARLRYEDADARRLVVQRISSGEPASTLLELELGAAGATSTIAPDGKTIAVAASSGTLTLHSLDDSPTPAPTTMASGPAGPRLVAGFGHQATIASVAFSPDGQLLATADDDGRIWIWETRSGRAIRSARLDGAAVVRFSDDARSILAVDSRDLVSIDVATGAIGFRRASLGDRPYLLEEGTQSGEFASCTLRGCGYLDAERQLPRRVALPATNFAAAVHCDDRFALLDRKGEDRSLVIVTEGNDLPSRTPLAAPVQSLACSQGSGFIAGTADGIVQRISADGDVLAAVQVGTRAISQIAGLPDGSMLVIETGIGYVGRPDLPARLIHLTAELSILAEAPFPEGEAGTAAYPAALAVTADGRLAFTATQTGLGEPGKMALWQTDGLSRIGELRGGALAARQVQFLPDGSGLAVTRTADTAIWSFTDGKPAATLDHGFRSRPSLRDDRVFSVAATGDVSRRSPGRGMEPLTLPPELSAIDLIGAEPVLGRDALAVGFFDGTVIWRSAIGAAPEPLVVRTEGVGGGATRSLSPDDGLLLTQSWNELVVHDIGDSSRSGEGVRLWREQVVGTVNAAHGQDAGFTLDGRNVLVGGDGGIRALDARDGQERVRIDQGVLVQVPVEDGRPAAKMILRFRDDDTAALMRSAEDTGSAIVRLGGLAPQFAVADHDGEILIIAGLGGETLLWRTETGLVARLSTEVADVGSVAFSPDRNLVALAGTDGVVHLLDANTGDEMAALISLADGGWAVADRTGRYDAADPGNVPDVSWVVAGEPTRPEPIEIYFLDYFEPRLLARHVSGERFAERLPPSARNRVTPELTFESAVPAPGQDGETPRAAVTIKLRSRERAGQWSGVGAVKLFRDGQLIATQVPEATHQGDWTTVTFHDVALPPDRDQTVLTAFAFNDDGIKSETVSRTVAVPNADTSARRRAYVIAIGVNDYDNPSWNLRYAAADAEAHATFVAAGLRNTGRFEEVFELPLVSRSARAGEALAPPRLASRADVVAVLERLAGDPVSRSFDSAMQDLLSRLPAVRPQDFVYIAFAGHGLATPDGRFHLFTQDFGRGATGRLVDDLSGSLDSEHLAALLSRIDARDMLFVIDACNSAASVAGGGFRPGPMDSRGLGQLAYDKSMRVLAASQVEGVALESDRLLHGALTYALLREGLESGLADQRPRDGDTSFAELIAFAEERVPDLYAELRDGNFTPLGRGAKSLLDGEAQRGELKVQRPAVFDFRPSGAEPILMRLSR